MIEPREKGSKHKNSLDKTGKALRTQICASGRLIMAATIVPTVLTFKNYDTWSSRIKSYLLAEDLWDIVEGTYDPEHNDWGKKNAKALYAIKNSCQDDIDKFIQDKITAKEAWNTLLKTLKPGYNEPSFEIDRRTILQAYTTPTLADHKTTPEVSMEEGRTQGHDESNANNIRETFLKYVESKDWDNAINLLRQHPQLRSERTSSNGTVLHDAVLYDSNCSVRNMEQLVDLMEKEDLEIQDAKGCTAFYSLAGRDSEVAEVEVAKRMVAKNDNLLTIFPACLYHPVVRAEMQFHGEIMARYLYSITPHETLRVSDGAHLISLGFIQKRFDIAWDLIQRYPQLASAKDNGGRIPLQTLAGDRLAFLSGKRLSLWENLIYYGIRIKPLPSTFESDQGDQRHLSNKKENQRPLSDQKENRRHLISSVMGFFRRLVTNLQKLLGIDRIYEMKLMHKRVDQFLPLMWLGTKDTHENLSLSATLREALEVALKRGHVEYITHFLRNELNDGPFHLTRNLETFANVTSKTGQCMFQIVAEYRHDKLYNLLSVYRALIMQDEYIHRVTLLQGCDCFGNNLLHTVASISSLSKIDHIQGAALQMQRELQWFKEVESSGDPFYCERVNDDGKTPGEVFTENHKELGKAAEKSMKETATSCTVVGALVITIMFAAAFTVPGGNDENTGLPKFLTKKLFTVFIVSDAISLFSSTTSVIMFLGILTSRYSEDDFLKSLPTKMIIGLFALFLSIVTMMIVFSCALYIMLDGKSTIVIPSTLLASVPIASFIWMQFPLLVELFISTFGRGIFDKKPYEKLLLNSNVNFS